MTTSREKIADIVDRVLAAYNDGGSWRDDSIREEEAVEQLVALLTSEVEKERERLLDYCEEWKRPSEDGEGYEKVYFISETDFKKALSDIGGKDGV